ncbi:DUF1707 domain-containing protein [Streptomyces sp. NPDC046557]|uniref:DUF1707 SHOCT-like domain-containing protein n=1 Tax=Streptomyces sp. NPDC046557 TaxID=3155372 RepID=UPI00340B2376
MDLEKHPNAPAASAAPAVLPVADLRASDADRDRIAHLLADALAEGRLTAEEHSDRLDTLYAVKTVGQLDVLVRDLPAAHGGAWLPAAGTPPVPVAGPVGAEAETVLAVCSSATRKGRWRPGALIRAVSVLGDVSLDLTEAVFEQRVTEINVNCVLGNVEIVVPENVTLRGYGGGVLGNFEVTDEGVAAADPQAPLVIVRGFALLGNIEARPKRGARVTDLAGKRHERLGG